MAEAFQQSASTDVNSKGKKSRKKQTKVRTLAQAQALFARNLDFIRDLAYSNPQLLATDCEQIIESTARYLPGYAHMRMPDNDEAFQIWIRAIVEAAVSRIVASYWLKKQFYSMKKQYADSVREGLLSVLKYCSSLGFSPEFDIPALESEVWMSVWNNLDNWLGPGTVSMSTRLIKFARLFALGWRSERIRDRDKWLSVDSFIEKEESGLPDASYVLAQSPQQENLYTMPKELSKLILGTEGMTDVERSRWFEALPDLTKKELRREFVRVSNKLEHS